MANNANQSKTYRIYIKSTKEWVEVSEEFYREQTSYYDTFRKKAQYHGQCVCPKNKFWLCDGDCFNCEFRRAGDMLSLDYENENEDGDTCSPLDSVPDTAPLMADVVADKLLQRLLHLRISLVAQLHREADDRRLRDLDGLAEAAGGHERSLVVVGQDVGRDLFLALGKGVDIILNIGQNVCRHNKFPPLRPCSSKIIKSLLFYRLRPHFASRNHDLGKIL